MVKTRNLAKKISQPKIKKTRRISKTPESDVEVKEIETPVSHIRSDVPIKSPKIDSIIDTTVKISTWNICGLRAMLKKGALLKFIQNENPDILCLNETLMTDKAMKKIESLLPAEFYKYWNHSKTRQGYSGTSVWSKVQPVSIQYGIGIHRHDQEGRVIVAEYPKYYVVCNYVPNAGRDFLYRIHEWDIDIRDYINKLQQVKPVIWCGDMNVIHEEIDIWSLKGKEDCACCTPQERRNFNLHLLLNDMIDTWRYLHPHEQGWSYYSRRNVGARDKNQGWRLDYILVSRALENSILDSYMKHEEPGSDHHPVVLILKVD